MVSAAFLSLFASPFNNSFSWNAVVTYLYYLILKLTNCNPNKGSKNFFKKAGLPFSFCCIKHQTIILQTKHKQMKKLLLVLAIGAFVASCNNSTDAAAAAADSTAKAATDTIKAAGDSAKAIVDSTVKAAVDTVKAKADSIKK
jgi:hypothetical protein